MVKLVYNTRKCCYGVTLLSMCDARKQFTWCRSGVPGSVTDSRAFKDSEWYRRQTTQDSACSTLAFTCLETGVFPRSAGC